MTDWDQLTQIIWEAPLPLLATCAFCVACIVATFVLVGKEFRTKENEKK